MLNISGLKEGVVLDHIEAGRSMDIYYQLGLDKLDCQVAIIKNARSSWIPWIWMCWATLIIISPSISSTTTRL